MIIENYTNEEYYKLNGTLSRERMEFLIEFEEKYNHIIDMESIIEEGISQFPEEDCLQELIGELKDDIKPGYLSKEKVKNIFEILEKHQYEIYGKSEYGIVELRKLLNPD